MCLNINDKMYLNPILNKCKISKRLIITYAKCKNYTLINSESNTKKLFVCNSCNKDYDIGSRNGYCVFKI